MIFFSTETLVHTAKFTLPTRDKKMKKKKTKNHKVIVTLVFSFFAQCLSVGLAETLPYPSLLSGGFFLFFSAPIVVINSSRNLLHLPIFPI